MCQIRRALFVAWRLDVLGEADLLGVWVTKINLNKKKHVHNDKLETKPNF